MTAEKLRVAREMLADGGHTMQQIADTIGVGRATLYRHLDPPQHSAIERLTITATRCTAPPEETLP